MSFDIGSFRADGVQVVRDFFEPDLRERFEALGRQIVADVAGGGVTRSAQFTSGLDVEAAAQVADSSALRGVAHEVLGPDVCWLVSRVLMKDTSFSSAIEAHQDWPYFGGDTRKLNIFVPLTRCRKENGMIAFLRGSHCLGPVERGAIDYEKYPQFDAVMPDIDVGDVLFADFLTWHYSVPAADQDPRILLQVVLQPSTDRSSNFVFGQGWQDIGPVLPRRNAPMLNAVPTVGIGLARELFGHGVLDEAAAIVRGLLVDSPLNIEAHLLQGDIAEKRGQERSSFDEAAREALQTLGSRLPLQQQPASMPAGAIETSSVEPARPPWWRSLSRQSKALR